MKNHLRIIPLLLAVSAILFSCREKVPDPFDGEQFVVKEVSRQGGSVLLEEAGEAVFLAGTFNPSAKIKMEMKHDENTAGVFNVSAPLYGVDVWLEYEIRINTGASAPKLPVEVKLFIPEYFQKLVTTGMSVEAFAQWYYENNSERHDNFSIIESKPAVDEPYLEFTLPPHFFTNVRSEDGSFEAIVTMASIP
ncbi:MAG TPA: hypothetical protein VEA37_00715, partial [Flavobacterium sp.]|nr:hypothetical protein [Flavobacterium sp.]